MFFSDNIYKHDVETHIAISQLLFEQQGSNKTVNLRKKNQNYKMRF